LASGLSGSTAVGGDWLTYGGHMTALRILLDQAATTQTD